MQTFLIAGGNKTLLVWDCPQNARFQVVKEYLGKVEQIGFVDYTNGIPKLTMMGNELCINGIIAFASTLSRSGKMYASGLSEPFEYKNRGSFTSIDINLPFKKIQNIILFPGIGFIYLKRKKRNIKSYLQNLCKKNALPAFGLVYLEENKITPYVFVKETNSLFQETACGSASITISLLEGLKNVIQPTGKIIRILRNRNRFTVGAKVVMI